MLGWLFKSKVPKWFSALAIGDKFYKQLDNNLYKKTSGSTYETIFDGKSCGKWFIVREDFSIIYEKPT